MGWITPQLIPQMAMERGWTTWEAIISNWALQADLNDYTNIYFPNTVSAPDPFVPSTANVRIPSVYGVAIGPASTIDRCIVQWDINLTITIPTSGDTAIDFQPYDQKLLSIDEPIMEPLSGPLTVIADSIQRFPDYFMTGDHTEVAFNFRPWTTFRNLAATLTPQLDLLFYLQPGLNIPVKRYPSLISGDFSTTSIGTPVFRKGFPIMGRKRARVMLNNRSFVGPGATVPIRIGLVGGPRGTGASANLALFETTFTTIDVPVDTTVSVTLGSEDLVGAWFLTVWTVTSPANTLISMWLEAYD